MVKKMEFLEAIEKSDKEIMDAIEKQYKWNRDIPHLVINVNVKNGWVDLQGEVEWDQQKKSAEKSIQNLLGIKGISNNIKIKSKREIYSGQYHSFAEMKNKIYESFDKPNL